MSTGLYIHIPFCLRKCPYCDFYSIPFNTELADAYLDAVCEVIKSGRFSPDNIDTIYFGGGTPSIFGVERLAAVLDCARRNYNVSPDAEISLEVNPASELGPMFKELRRAGFNRVSIGAQSGVDEELAALGRPHLSADTEWTVSSAREAGFKNISCDLMLAIPGQNSESLKASVDFLARLGLTHVSAYMLKLEEGTPFAQKNPPNLPGEDESADLYLEAARLLKGAGVEQYEISNFAVKGMECAHNLKYWRCEPYLGIGPSAHSFLNGTRFSFEPNLKGFISDPFSILKTDDSIEGFETYAMLRLRLSEGLDLNRAESLFGVCAADIERRATPFISSGLARLENGVFSLTTEGFLLSNSIISALVF